MSGHQHPVPDPDGHGEWIPQKSGDGKTYWVNHTLKKTAWEPPRAPTVAMARSHSQPQQPYASYQHAPAGASQFSSYHDAHVATNQQSSNFQTQAAASTYVRPVQAVPPPDELPQGWEARTDSTGRVYYVDHNSKKTHWSIPPYLLSGSAAASIARANSASQQQGAAAGLQRASTFGSRRAEEERGGAAPARGGLAHSVSFRPQPSYMNPGAGSAAAAAAAAAGGPVQPPPPVMQREGSGPSAPPSMEDFRRMYSNSQFQVGTDGAQQRAIQYAECVVCFDDMHKEPAGVFTQNGRRTCPHFLHHRCAVEIKDSARGSPSCPICRRAFNGVLQIPQIHDDPDGWFRAVDLSGDNSLNQREVLEVLKAQIPIDYDRLEQELPELFKRWDVSGTGTITKQDMMHPQKGLLQHVRTEFLRHASDSIPDIRDNKVNWFDHFDYDHSGTLEQAEIVRALIKTFKLSEDRDRLDQMRSVVNAVWGVFDTDGNGTIDKEEFVSPDGLADAIIASMSQMRL